MRESVCFRHQFRYDPAEWPDCQGFKLAIESKLPRVEAWLNGTPLEVPAGAKKEISLPKDSVRRGQNLLAFAVGPSETPQEEEKKGGAGGKAQDVRLEAELDRRPGDQILTREQLEQLGLFKSLSKMPRVEEFPGSIVLRKYKKGDVICYQGEPGSSAFYILTAEDLLDIRKLQLKFSTEELRDVTIKELMAFSPTELLGLLDLRESQLAEIEQLRAAARKGRLDPATEQRATELQSERDQLARIAPLARETLAMQGTETRVPERLVAHALILPSGSRVRVSGLLGRIKQRLVGGGATPLDVEPATIRNDGPSDIDYKTRRAPMYQGEQFGEMACMTHAPRSATVVAERDCYMLEFLKNVFNLIQKDDGYRERMLKVYRERVLASHLQKMEFFRSLSPEQMQRLGEGIDMKIVDAGTVICNEGEPSDCVYIIKTGLVQVVRGIKGMAVAIGDEDVTDWTALAQAILEGDAGVIIPCPNCNHQLRLPDRAMLGRFGRCPECRHKFLLVDPQSADEVELELAEMPAGKTVALSISPLAKQAAKPGAKAGGDGDPRSTVWNLLSPIVKQAVRFLATGEGDVMDQRIVLVALNDLIKDREFVSLKELGSLLKNDEATATFPRNKKQWTGLQICIAGRLMIQALYSDALKEPPKFKSSGPLAIRAYLGGGDIFGEAGVVQQQPRTATCIAYDHPVEEGSSRTPGQVELIVIKAEAFEALLDESPETRAAIEEQIAETARRNAERDAQPVYRQSNSIVSSPEFQDQGFIQGQKLMLIDLDSCTRCGDCVRACIGTHDDGFTRLFLDGPRFDRFLVPSACRNCIDPACMIGCPVGSIQRGDNGQIVIRDWCIGCGACGRQCPYDSIQMHDTGLVRSDAPGWRFTSETTVAGKNWTSPKYGDSRWTEARAPFQWDLEFQEGLTAARETLRAEPPAAGDGPEAAIKYRDTVLNVRLDVDRKPPLPPGAEESGVELRLKVLPQIAVVCDQCSTRPNKEPACVEYCPHEAAMRVDARTNFPIGMSN